MGSGVCELEELDSIVILYIVTQHTQSNSCFILTARG
jgi:hypothetical protein